LGMSVADCARASEAIAREHDQPKCAISETVWLNLENGTEEGAYEMAAAARVLDVPMATLVFGDA
jgi:hypothetical protein